MYNLLEYAINVAESEGASQAEAFSTKSSTLFILIENKQVKSAEYKCDAGVGVRVLLRRNRGHSIGFAFSMELTRSAVERSIKEAVKVAKVKAPDDSVKSFQEPKKMREVENLHDDKVSVMEAEEAVNLANEMVEKASADNRIVSMSGDVAFTSYETYIANSLGLNADYRATIFRAYSLVTAKENGSIGTGTDDYASRLFNAEKALEVAESSSSIAISQLKPKPVKGGVMDAVIDPQALQGLFASTVAQGIRADYVQKNQSPLAGKISEKVSSEIVTIVDEGLIPGAVGSKPFDDEGCPTQSTIIIEKGFLKSFLYNTFTAQRENRESTGNSLRVSSMDLMQKYALEPQVGLTNLVIKPGNETLESLIAQVKNGLYIKDFIGTHTANRVTGEFSVMPFMAYKIENGEVKHPVKEAMVGGNIMDFLKNIVAAGKDLKQCQAISDMSPDSAIISPPLLVKNLSVSA